MFCTHNKTCFVLTTKHVHVGLFLGALVILKAGSRGMSLSEAAALTSLQGLPRTSFPFMKRNPGDFAWSSFSIRLFSSCCQHAERTRHRRRRLSCIFLIVSLKDETDRAASLHTTLTMGDCRMFLRFPSFYLAICEMKRQRTRKQLSMTYLQGRAFNC